MLGYHTFSLGRRHVFPLLLNPPNPMLLLLSCTFLSLADSPVSKTLGKHNHNPLRDILRSF